jgi:hypothetical protein
VSRLQEKYSLKGYVESSLFEILIGGVKEVVGWVSQVLRGGEEIDSVKRKD